MTALYMNREDRDGGRGYPGHPSGLAERSRSDSCKPLADFGRKSADTRKIEPIGDDRVFKALEPLDRLRLASDVTGIFDLGLELRGLVCSERRVSTKHRDDVGVR